MNTIITKIQETYTCQICQRIAFPPVKWNVQTPFDNNIPRCVHMYCLNCTRLYFQLDTKIVDRKPVRYECLVCQQPLNRGNCYNGNPANAKDVYYHCSNDEYIITQQLVLNESQDGIKCVYEECQFKTSDPYKMKAHNRHDCNFNVITCSNRQYGCKFTGKRQSINEHNLNCEYKPVKCKLCSLLISSKYSNDHLIKYHFVTKNIDFSYLLQKL
jgi:hypothetical protein